MWWVFGIVGLLACAGAVWLLVPTIRTFRGPGFEPSRRDDESVLLAEQPGIVNGGDG